MIVVHRSVFTLTSSTSHRVAHRTTTFGGVSNPCRVSPLAIVLDYFAGFVFTALLTRTRLVRKVNIRTQTGWTSLRPRRFLSDELKKETGDESHSTSHRRKTT
jgi:hypothetical protein